MSRTLETLGLLAVGCVSGAIACSVYLRPKEENLKKLQGTPLTIGEQYDLVHPADYLTKYGNPGPTSDLHYRKAYVSAYDRRMRNPLWVAEHITAQSLARRNGDRKHSVFAEDSMIPSKFQAKLQDYFRSGYDRGHQIPAADAKFSQEAMDETFSLSNVAPQVGEGFNRDYWAHLEDFCRRLTLKFDDVRVVTGPLYLPKRYPDGKWRVSYEVIGTPPNVAVPTHFYKIVIGEEKGENGEAAVAAFVIPNAEIENFTPLTEFLAPLEAVERASGLNFTEKLNPDVRSDLCKKVECTLVIRQWADQQRSLSSRPIRDR